MERLQLLEPIEDEREIFQVLGLEYIPPEERVKVGDSIGAAAMKPQE